MWELKIFDIVIFRLHADYMIFYIALIGLYILIFALERKRLQLLDQVRRILNRLERKLRGLPKYA